jgi:hypothetical protein
MDRNQQLVLEILTARAHGDETLERQLVLGLLTDESEMSAVIGSLFRLSEDLLDILADQQRTDRVGMIRFMALRVAAREADPPPED